MVSSVPPPTRDGHSFDEAASALQKSVRRSDEEGAVYWALQLAEHTPAYVWYRLSVVCSEDVGLAGDVALPATIHALHAAFEETRRRKGGAGQAGIFVAHAAMLLARSPKSGIVGNAQVALQDVPREVEDVALDKHTARGRALGRGWDHFWDESSWYADPETGELTATGSMPDPYRDRARAALGHPPAPQRPKPDPAQLPLEEES